MAERDTGEPHLPPRSATVPEADALEQALPPSDADPEELLEVEDEPEIGIEVPEADAMEQSRSRAVPAAVARPIPFDAPEHDVLEQRRPATHEDDDDDFRQ